MSLINRDIRRNLDKTTVKIINEEKLYQPIKTPDDPAPTFIKNVNPNGNSGASLSDDGTILWGRRVNLVSKSVDKGKTFVDTVMPGLETSMTHLEILKDGHILAWTLNSTTGQGKVFKSSNTALDATTTWGEKLAFEHGMPHYGQFGLSVHNNVIIFNEYINVVGQTGNGRHVWLSTDFGETWKNVLTLPDNSPDQHHAHDSCFDPYTKWLWVCTGDGIEYRNVYYSKDFGDTWETLWVQGQAPAQFTNVIARPECVLFGTDSLTEWFVYRYDKETEVIDVIYSITPTAGTQPLLAAKARNIVESDGTVVTYIPWRAQAQDNKWRVLATADGYNFYPLYITPVVDGSGLANVLGVSDDGDLLIQGSGFTGIMQKPNFK